MNNKINYRGMIHPINEQQVIPSIKSYVGLAIERFSQQDEVTKEEVLETLQTINELTTPTGYYYNEYKEDTSLYPFNDVPGLHVAETGLPSSCENSH